MTRISHSSTVLGVASPLPRRAPSRSKVGLASVTGVSTRHYPCIVDYSVKSRNPSNNRQEPCGRAGRGEATAGLRLLSRRANRLLGPARPEGGWSECRGRCQCRREGAPVSPPAAAIAAPEGAMAPAVYPQFEECSSVCENTKVTIVACGTQGQNGFVPVAHRDASTGLAARKHITRLALGATRPPRRSLAAAFRV